MMAEKIKSLREGHHMTQNDLARLCGVAIPTISKWESGITAPRLPMLRRLASIFRVDMNYFEDEAPVGKEYYYNEEVTAIVQEMFENPERRVLFDASRGLSRESLEEVKRFIEFQKAKEGKMV